MRKPERSPKLRSVFSSSSVGLAGSPVKGDIGNGVFLTHQPRYSVRPQKRNESGAGAGALGFTYSSELGVVAGGGYGDWAKTGTAAKSDATRSQSNLVRMGCLLAF